MVFMALEMVAGRLVVRHLGSSIYGWSSVIAVLLAGLSMGNFLGGKVADFIQNEKQASWLFLLASILCLSVLVLETPPQWILHRFFDDEPQKSLLAQASTLTTFPGTKVTLTWPYRILVVVTAVFFLPALSMGTVSPVVAKLAVDRLRRFRRTGTAIGQVYAWGMVGSILGTFLTGFVLIDYLGTKGVILALGTILALGATFLGELFHAVWAGIPLGLCVIAFTPPGWVDVFSKVFPQVNGKSFSKMGEDWGVREPMGDPTTTSEDLAWIDESDYYYIKVENEPEEGGEIQRRTLVLDNLIHGYFILNHPERLDYDYEHIYALVAYRAAKAGGKVKFKPTPEASPPGQVPADGAEAKPARRLRPRSPPRRPRPRPARRPRVPQRQGRGEPARQVRRTAEGRGQPEAKSPAPPKAEASAPPEPKFPPAPAKEDSAKPGAGFLSIAASFQDDKAPPETAKKDAPAQDPSGSPRRRKPGAADGKNAEAGPADVPPGRDQGPQGHLRPGEGPESGWRQERAVYPARRVVGAEDAVPRGRRLLLPAAHAVRLPGHRRRRRRDRPGRHAGQPDGHRPAGRHEDRDLLGRRPTVRRAAQGHQAVRPDLRRRVQRLLGPLAPHHQRVQREAQEDADPGRRVHDQHHRRLPLRRRGEARRPSEEIEENKVKDEAGKADPPEVR